MSNQQDAVERIIRLVEQDAELEARMDTEARATAHALIQGYLGPDHRVISIPDFYSALVQALKAARHQGHADCHGEVLPFE